MKLRDTLRNYGGFKVDITTDEEIGDILVAIKYHDHGDEFLFVKTYSGEMYEYGYYLDRINCMYEFDITKNSGESEGNFIRRPIMRVDMDTRRRVDASNKVFKCVYNDTYGMIEWAGYKVEKRNSANYIFNNLIDNVKEVIDSNVLYDFRRHRDTAIEFAKLNELGEDSLRRIGEIKWNNNDDVVGIAGKRNGSSILYGDGLISVLYRGRNFDINKVTYKRHHTDEWGCQTYSLSTRQFQ